MPPRARSTRRRNATRGTNPTGGAGPNLYYEKGSHTNVDPHPADAFIILAISKGKYRTLKLPGQTFITLQYKEKTKKEQECDLASPSVNNDSGIDLNTPTAGPEIVGLQSVNERSTFIEYDVPAFPHDVEATIPTASSRVPEPPLSAVSPAINVIDRSGRDTVTLRRGRSKAKQQIQPEVNSSLVITLPIPKARLRFLGENMAPVKDVGNVPSTIKEVIQHLYDIQSQTHGFIPETQDLLVDKMTELTQSLSHLQKLTSTAESPNNPVHDIRIAPEIVDYVDDGRNPDIFTREFVENVQRSNAVINGKQQAFRDFSQVFAKALKEGISGVDRHVDRIMEQAGMADETVRNGNGNGKDSGSRQ